MRPIVRFAEWNGEKRSLTDLSKEFGVPLYLVCNRLKLGWSIKDALTRKVRPKALNPETIKESEISFDKPQVIKEIEVDIGILPRGI